MISIFYLVVAEGKVDPSDIFAIQYTHNIVGSDKAFKKWQISSFKA
jgi:hypothetical protein